MIPLEYRILTDDELTTSLATLPGWKLEDGQIVKRYEFKSYKDGLVFAIAVGHLADKLDHHPDLSVGYAKVKVAMNTHAVKGISPYDIELASRIQEL